MKLQIDGLKGWVIVTEYAHDCETFTNRSNIIFLNDFNAYSTKSEALKDIKKFNLKNKKVGNKEFKVKCVKIEDLREPEYAYHAIKENYDSWYLPIFLGGQNPDLF